MLVISIVIFPAGATSSCSESHFLHRRPPNRSQWGTMAAASMTQTKQNFNNLRQACARMCGWRFAGERIESTARKQEVDNNVLVNQRPSWRSSECADLCQRHISNQINERQASGVTRKYWTSATHQHVQIGFYMLCLHCRLLNGCRRACFVTTLDCKAAHALASLASLTLMGSTWKWEQVLAFMSLERRLGLPSSGAMNMRRQIHVRRG